MRYQIITLVDITRSNANRSETDKLKVGQQANFNSLIQAIGMRANIEWHQDPQRHTGRIPLLDGKAVHWIWEFDVERDAVFLKGDDPVGHLVDDLNNVPIVSDLTNSADLYPAAFQTQGDSLNTWVSII
jgi:hypothetical protein